MRAEPYIDAINVKRVVTNRKRSNVIVLFELEKTHCTLVNAALPRVDGEGNRLDDRLVESVRRQQVESVSWIEGGRIVGRRLDVATGGGGRDVGSEEAPPPPPPPPAAVLVD